MLQKSYSLEQRKTHSVKIISATSTYCTAFIYRIFTATHKILLHNHAGAPLLPRTLRCTTATSKRCLKIDIPYSFYPCTSRSTADGYVLQEPHPMEGTDSTKFILKDSTERPQTRAGEKCEEGAGVWWTYYNPQIPLHRWEWERQGMSRIRSGIKQIQQLRSDFESNFP